LSFFKRLIPLKAEMRMNLENITVENGQPFKGTATLASRDKFNVEEVRMEIRVKESWEEPAIERDAQGNQRQVMKKRENVLFSRDVPVSQAFSMGEGDGKDFPFEVTIPMRTPSRYGSSIQYSLKAVANVKGRPDVTKEVLPMVVPATVVMGSPMGAQVTQVIQKEVIKLPCRYCNTLVDFTSGVNKCPSCGAPLQMR
jgi:sporulation-control protein spo0M